MVFALPSAMALCCSVQTPAEHSLTRRLQTSQMRRDRALYVLDFEKTEPPSVGVLQQHPSEIARAARIPHSAACSNVSLCGNLDVRG